MRAALIVAILWSLNQPLIGCSASRNAKDSSSHAGKESENDGGQRYCGHLCIVTEEDSCDPTGAWSPMLGALIFRVKTHRTISTYMSMSSAPIETAAPELRELLLTKEDSMFCLAESTFHAESARYERDQKFIVEAAAQVTEPEIWNAAEHAPIDGTCRINLGFDESYAEVGLTLTPETQRFSVKYCAVERSGETTSCGQESSFDDLKVMLTGENGLFVAKIFDAQGIKAFEFETSYTTAAHAMYDWATLRGADGRSGSSPCALYSPEQAR